MISAVIVAAGKGLRMRTAQRKQFLELSGLPILVHTLRAFDAIEIIEQMVVVVPADEIDYCRKHILKPAQLNTKVLLEPGGAHRQDSVYNGLKRLADETGIVLIHDGVRPLVGADTIHACIHGAQRWSACIPVILPVDTLKQIGADGVVTQTIDRATMRLAQTPQAFRVSLIQRAHGEAHRNGWKATDDASLVERIGEQVHVIEGSPENLKITTPLDLAVAEIYLQLKT